MTFTKLIVCFVCSACLILTFSQDACADSILYPQDSSWTGHSPVAVVIRGSSEDIESVQVVISTEDRGRTLPDISLAPALKDVIHVTIPLERGSNEILIEIHYLDHESEKLQLNMFYSPAHSGMSDMPVGYESRKFHLGDPPASCRECHDIDVNDTLPNNPTQSSCYLCHKRLTEREHVHGPCATFQCLTCHRSGNDGFTLAAQRDTLCFLCHVEEESHFRRKFVHGPVSTGDCLVCHDEHSSDNRFMLRGEINSVCANCHPEEAYVNHPVNRHPTANKPDPLRPGRDLSCTSCHDPHSSDISQFMFYRSTSSFSICTECHDK